MGGPCNPNFFENVVLLEFLVLFVPKVGLSKRWRLRTFVGREEATLFLFYVFVHLFCRCAILGLDPTKLAFPFGLIRC